ncbi:MAG: hypothetical protein WCT03_22260 [Candidatus Obscuribacterales bacterium]
MQTPPSDDLPLKQRPSYWTKFITESKESPSGITVFIKKRRCWSFFSAADKKHILDELDNTPAGKVAAVLLREEIYSSAIQQRRQEEKERGLEEKKRGPKTNTGVEEMRKLRAELARSQNLLVKANEDIQLRPRFNIKCLLSSAAAGR